MRREGSAGRFRDAWRSRDLQRMAAITVIDGLGSWATTAALLVYVFDRTDSTASLALLSSARWIPSLLFASYGGVLADRFERTRVVVVTDLMAGATMLTLLAVVAGDGPMWVIFALQAVQAAALAPNRAASGALTPELVPERDLAAANGLISTLEYLVVVVGPALGGLAAAANGVEGALAANAASFFIAAAIAARLELRSRGDAGEAGESAFTAFLDGVKVLRTQGTAVVLVLFLALAVGVYGASSVLFVRLSEERLGTGAEGYSYLLAGLALGSAVAAGIANRLSALRRLAPVILGAILVMSLPYLIVTQVHVPAIAFTLTFVVGTGMIVIEVLAITALQRDTPRGVLGRVLSLVDVACLLTTVVSSFLFAATLETIGLGPSLAVVGIGFPVLAVVGIGPVVRADHQNLVHLREIEPRIELLQELDLLTAATRPALEQLATAVEVFTMSAAADIVREGQPADALWILVEGEASVSAQGEPIRTLGPRSYFGEIGVLRGFRRTATVRTTGPALLWRIHGKDFLDAIESGASASASLLGVALTRLARTHPKLATPPPGAPVSEPG